MLPDFGVDGIIRSQEGHDQILPMAIYRHSLSWMQDLTLLGQTFSLHTRGVFWQHNVKRGAMAKTAFRLDRATIDLDQAVRH
jgi:hypothetical protein